MFPEEAVLSYYNFEPHNRKNKTEYSITPTTIASNPALRYSEGFFYFIMGEAARPAATAATANSVSIETTAQAKDQAWTNLLKYLNKERISGDGVLRDHLRDLHFVPVASRLNTNSSSTNNQKVLFAIRASYIDALPD